MIKSTLVSLVLLFFPSWLAAQSLQLKAGIKISRSVKLKNNLYRLAPGSIDSVAVIVIEGNDITIDFNRAVLQGSTDVTNPDRFKGIAIEVRNSRNVTIKNLVVKGYKTGLIARNVEGLVIRNSDFSYNYRPRLQSTQQKEDLSDWLSYHRNENDEWLRYGAGIYLISCQKAIVSGCTATGNQNGLLMRDCNDGKFSDNQFNFNSGIGIGMYRCSRNEVSNNNLMFNIRGYSHDVYQRGQDSAGILVFEQSSNNLFLKNTATHSGDGFFLWAGQATMETGEGGCNDNRVVGNNFSYAAANGIEATFSRNNIQYNQIDECENGIWAGYSYDTKIANNRFRRNKVAVAIEHGQHNEISYNLFDRDQQAIRLWSNPVQPDWGYVRKKNTGSREYVIMANSFNGNEVAYDLKASSGLNIFNNTYGACVAIYKTAEDVNGIDSTVYDEILQKSEADSSLSDLRSLDFSYKAEALLGRSGRKQIRMTEWGPYNFEYPVIWNTNPVDTGNWMEFELRGPDKGRWKLRGQKGLDSISVRSGTFPATLRAKRTGASGAEDILLEMQYTGPAYRNTFGERETAGNRSFVFRKFFQPLNWEVLWFAMDTAWYNPLRERNLFSPTAKMAPVKRDTVSDLNYIWRGGLKTAGRTFDQFITTAGTRVEKGGDYELSVTWQGAVRVIIGEKTVLDAWRLQKGGDEQVLNRRVKIHLDQDQYIRVEYLGLGDLPALSVKLLPGR